MLFGLCILCHLHLPTLIDMCYIYGLVFAQISDDPLTGLAVLAMAFHEIMAGNSFDELHPDKRHDKTIAKALFP